MDEENILDFNFWPSFSDLMLSLVLILVLVLFVVSAILNVGTIDLSNVGNNQKDIIIKIREAFGIPTKKEDREAIKDITVIKPPQGNEGDIFIKNEPTVQKITFSSHILFQPDEVDLNENGRKVLFEVGKILSKYIKSELIREIQIQGHADPTPSEKYHSNLELAAMRAISVFNFFKDDLGEDNIDPIENLMSVTSFGEYKPVQRSEDKPYNKSKLDSDNDTPKKKEGNRRIELLIFYQYQPTKKSDVTKK